MITGPLEVIPSLFSIRYAWRRALLDKENQVIFVPIPKVASTSMQFFLLSKNGVRLEEEGFGQIKAAVEELRLSEHVSNPLRVLDYYEKCNVFYLIRHPIDRFISAHNMINTRPDFKKQMENKTGEVFRGENHVDRLIDYITQSALPDWHFLPQYWFIKMVKSDFVVRLGVDDVHSKISSAVGMSDWIEGFQDERLNESKNTNIDLTNEQIEKLRKIYHQDFELFGESPL